jgi:hypothetical protein
VRCEGGGLSTWHVVYMLCAAIDMIPPARRGGRGMWDNAHVEHIHDTCDMWYLHPGQRPRGKGRRDFFLTKATCICHSKKIRSGFLLRLNIFVN